MTLGIAAWLPTPVRIRFPALLPLLFRISKVWKTQITSPPQERRLQNKRIGAS
jgi:hypothetical protein